MRCLYGHTQVCHIKLLIRHITIAQSILLFYEKEQIAKTKSKENFLFVCFFKKIIHSSLHNLAPSDSVRDLFPSQRL